MKSRKTWRKVLSVSLAAAMLVGTSFSASEPLLGTGISVRAENTEQNAPVFSWDNATVYFLMTDRFNNGNEENDNAYGRQEIDVDDQRATFHGGDFAGITDKINEGYFNDLGVNAIWLTAPYEQIHGYVLGDNFAHYSYHGYYVLDYTEPDAAFGTKQEFQTLVDTAHEHGIRIVMDVVMNHAGYNDIIDMNEYNFGTLLDGWKKVYDDADFSQYHSKIDYSSSSSDWGRWWGSNWVRSGLPGYTENSGSELTACLTGLPDFKTEQTTKVGIPQFLQTKWTKEGTLEEKIEKYGSSNTVTGYISDWLAEWVRAYGIDGFRCDTAKHVDKSSWETLKTKCVAALNEWKEANPTKKRDDLDFWMTGEHWDWNIGYGKDSYFTEGGFDSMINFAAQGGGLLQLSKVAQTYQSYADRINSDPEFNVLSYISSHDSTLARPSDMYYMGSAFLLMPGAVQIYYGDETARDFVPDIPNDGNGGAGHSLRSDMNFGENADLTAHWGIVGRFRNNHLAVGAGANTALNTSSGIAFARTYNDDKIAAVINASGSVSVNVSSLWDNGTELENFYDGSKAVVTDGAVTFDAGEHGTILIQEPAEQAEGRGTVTVEHIDTENGSVLKTQTLSGVAGSSYSVSADTQLLKNYELVQTEGNATGTYSSEGAVVKFYYRALPVTALTIHYYNANWNNVNIYSYDQTETKQYTGKWPGTSMNSDGDGWWSYSIEDAENAFVIFNDGTNQDPGYMQPGYNVSDESWIKDGQILTESPEEPLPAGNISASPENGEFTDTVSVTLSASNATDTAYTTSEGVTGSFADGQTITIGQNTAPGDTVTLTLTGKGADGKALLQTYTYSKKTQTTENVLLYFDNSSYNWSNVYAYVYIGDGANSQSMAAWPGVKMTEKNSQGYFMLNVAEGFENGRVIFNDGTGSSVNRYPGDQQPGLSIGGSSKLFRQNHYWDTYTVEEPLTIRLDKTSVSVEEGKTVSLTATVTSENKAVVWTSSDTSIATVSDTGVVKGIKEGKATVTAALTDNLNVKASAEITVTAAESSLANLSDVSASKVELGQTVAVNAKAQGGNAPYRYEVIYKLSTASNWKTLQDYNSNASVSFTPDKAGTYNIRVTAKDAEGTTAEKNLSVTVQAPALENTSSLSATEIELGETVDITASATGGSGEYKYQIVYKPKAATSWSTLQPYGTNASASFNPSKAGDYDVCVKVKDSYNKEVKKFFEVSVKQPVPLENTSALSALNINLGDSIQVNCSATGGTGEYRYQVVYKQETQEKWSTAQPYSTTDSVSIKPAKAVVYDVCVKVKDSINTEVKKFYKVTVTDNRPKNISSISATSVELGETIVVKAKASGSTGFFQYAVYYKKSADTKWTTKQGFKANSTVVIQPAKATTYEICVKIQDDQGTVVKKYFTVEVTEHKDALSNTSTVSETNLVLGETAVVSASASGSTGFYQYAVSYRGENDTKWTVMQDYSSDDTVKVKPAAVGAYEICVSVRDNKKNEAKKYFTLNVSESSDD